METINVNLSKCDDGLACVSSDDECPATPVLIPCPIPRSVTFTVRLGECSGPCRAKLKSVEVPGHSFDCPARPIRVSCSISKKTWEESEVSEVEILISPMSIDDRNRIYAACRERWALVKALVLGTAFHAHGAREWRRMEELSKQRDAVYAALAAMAQCERSYWAAAQAVRKALPGVYVGSDMRVVDPGGEDGEAPSARWLASYVERLVEQTEAL